TTDEPQRLALEVRIGDLCLPLGPPLVAVSRLLQMSPIGLRLQHRQEYVEGRADVADRAVIDLRTPADVAPDAVDLDDGLPLRVEVLVREVGAQHQQYVAVIERDGTR